MIEFISRLLKKIFGTRNDRVVKRLRVVAEQAGALEPAYRALSDEDLSKTTPKLRARLEEGQTVADILPDAFAACREAGRRKLNMRHFDVQFIGGQVLFGGSIAEMATGEGKTLVATLPCYLQVLTGKHVHVVSVNDYLVKRDRDWMLPILEMLGLTSGAIQASMGSWGEGAKERQTAYACDITYGTNSELGFDYLRDNMKVRAEDQVQKYRHMALVDEADSILIDEARTPLIISGPAADDTTRYAKADEVARRLFSAHKPHADAQKRLDAAKRAAAKAEADIAESRKQRNETLEAKSRKTLEEARRNEEEAEADTKRRVAYYEVEYDRHTVRITHEGIAEAQRAAGVSSFYVGANMEWPHLMEQSLKAHILYDKDKHYVVQDGEVKIVDEFTGRILEGRQWSDGLHQAVEAKERVRIKEETQTLATITIQNFVKLYGKIAGMTGTALTEAEEFLKIYNVDVVNIPTNRPINRQDHQDIVYQDLASKHTATVDEIVDMQRRGRPHTGLRGEIHYYDVFQRLLKAYTKIAARSDAPANAKELLPKIKDIAGKLQYMGGNELTLLEEASKLCNEIFGEIVHGRPVLVGTTSIEKSEKLSGMLMKRYGIEHQVLNAKPENARRESEIVAEAGKIAAPKRGHHPGELWGTVTIATNMAGRGTDIKLAEGVVYKNCRGDLGPGTGTESEQKRRAWHEPGMTGTKCCMNCPDYDPSTNCAHCFKPKLDPRFPEFGRQVCPISPPCGLHIVGTERHEARRIDNQLRGRTGRQGDPGSSQFFLSLEDELLKIFMPEWTIRALKWLGLKEGEPIQHKRITKGIERAQKKVEERHFNARKHLLEYDEVMDKQRGIFYGRRQAILEGRDILKVIREMVSETLADGVKEYFAPNYRGKVIGEWAATKFVGMQIEPEAFHNGMELDEVETLVRTRARDWVVEKVGTHVGEYIPDEIEDKKEWDLSGLSGWAMSQFGVQLPSKTKLMEHDSDAISDLIREAAWAKIDAFDCAPAMKFLEADFPFESLCRWANEKFGFTLKVADINTKSPEAIRDLLQVEADKVWRRRETEEPAKYALSHFDHLGIDTAEASGFLSNWVKDRYKTEIPAAEFKGKNPGDLLPRLAALGEEWMHGGRLPREVDAAVDKHLGSADAAKGREDLAKWAEDSFGRRPHPEMLADKSSARDELVRLGRSHLRQELDKLEQRMLLDTYDRAWKDHLYNMDFLKESVGLQGWAEKDPRNVYKKEGYEMFMQTLAGIRERVTNRIFRMEVSDEDEVRSIYQISSAIHEDYAEFEAQQQQAMESASSGEVQKVQQIVIEGPKVGRNDPCWCNSGKKYKKCHGKNA